MASQPGETTTTPMQPSSRFTFDDQVPYVWLNSEPALRIPHDEAAAYRSRVRMPPFVDPDKDASIARVIKRRESYIRCLVAAMWDTSMAQDPPVSPERALFKLNDPKAVSPYEVEATCRVLFDTVIDRCKHGFRGPAENAAREDAKPRLLRAAYTAEDRDADCEKRVENVIQCLLLWKSACRDVMFYDHSHVLLANHPKAYCTAKNLKLKSTQQKNKAIGATEASQQHQHQHQQGAVQEGQDAPAHVRPVDQVGQPAGQTATPEVNESGFHGSDREQPHPLQSKSEVQHVEFPELGASMVDSEYDESELSMPMGMHSSQGSQSILPHGYPGLDGFPSHTPPQSGLTVTLADLEMPSADGGLQQPNMSDIQPMHAPTPNNLHFSSMGQPRFTSIGCSNFPTMRRSLFPATRHSSLSTTRTPFSSLSNTPTLFNPNNSQLTPPPGSIFNARPPSFQAPSILPTAPPAPYPPRLQPPLPATSRKSTAKASEDHPNTSSDLGHSAPSSTQENIILAAQQTPEQTDQANPPGGSSSVRRRSKRIRAQASIADTATEADERAAKRGRGTSV